MKLWTSGDAFTILWCIPPVPPYESKTLKPQYSASARVSCCSAFWLRSSGVLMWISVLHGSLVRYLGFGACCH